MSRFLYFFIISVILTGCQIKPKALSESETAVCQDLKTGKFKINHKMFGMTTTIVRNDSMQIETTEVVGTTIKFTYKIKWLNDCMYELTPSPSFQNDMDMSNESMIVKIKKVEGNIIHHRTYRNGNRVRSRSVKMVIVE